MQALLERLGGPRRALLLAVGVVMALLILGVSRWATAPTWVPAYSGLPLESVGKLTQALEQAGIRHRLDAGGTQISVASDDLARSRVVLASSGIPSAGRPGMELFDQPSWGMTDFTQRINYRRALEGEMERTIGKMSGIEQAQVHLALPERTGLRRAVSDKPPQASVVLKLQSGATPRAEVVEGIQHLVASSVDGLENENVTVLSEGGLLLSSPHDPGSLAGLSSQQLQIQREMESHLERKATDVLSPIVGGGNARVQVSAALNFDRIERTVQAVDPDRQAIATEQKALITPGVDSGAGSSNEARSYDNTRSVENYYGAVGTIRRLTVAVVVNDRIEGEGDKRRAIARSPEELTRMERTIRNAIGADSARGDQVTVTSVPFDGALRLEDTEPAPSLLERLDAHRQFLFSAIALLGIIAFAFVVLRAVRAPASPPAVASSAPLPGPGSTLDITIPPAGPGGAPAPSPDGTKRSAPSIISLTPEPGIREAIVKGVEENPEQAVRLVRQWIREG